MEKQSLINRDRFTFYKSYYDTYKELPIKDRPEFIETIMAVYFLEQKLEDIKPSTPMLKLAFSSISHSIKTSIKGLFDKKQIDYNSYPYQGAYQDPYQEQAINNKQQEIDNKEEEIKNTWNEFAKKNKLTEIIKLNEKRKKAINLRLKDNDFKLEDILHKISISEFLLGKTGWKVDFDFVFCSDSNYLKILEGKYDNKQEAQKPKSREQIMNEKEEERLRFMGYNQR